MTRRPAYPLVAMSVVALFITSCATGTGTESATESATEAATPNASASAADSAEPSESPAATGVIAEIQERGVLKVGMTATLRPFEYFEGDEIIGFDVDLINMIADELGVEGEAIDTDWAGVIPSLYAGQFDTIVSHMTVTPERAEQVIFSQPYGVSTMQFFTHADRDDLQTAADLEGLKIGGTIGSASQTAIEGWEAEGHEFAEVVYLQNFQEGILALDQGRVDAWAVTVAPAAVVVNENPGTYKLVEGFGPELYIGIPFREEDTNLCELVDTLLTDIKADGRFEEMQDEWLGFRVEVPDNYDAMEFPVTRC